MLIQNPLNTFKIPWFSRNFLGTCRYFLIKVIRNLFEPKYKRIELKWLVHEFHDLTFENQMSKLDFIAKNSAYILVIKKHLTLAKSPNQVFRKFKNSICFIFEVKENFKYRFSLLGITYSRIR